jgi:hypothetical protein
MLVIYLILALLVLSIHGEVRSTMADNEFMKDLIELLVMISGG